MERVMIHIDRPPEPPRTLETAGTRKTEENCERYDRDQDDYRGGLKKFSFSKNVYGRESVKQTLPDCCINRGMLL